MSAAPGTTPEQDFHARLAAAGLRGLSASDLAWLRAAYDKGRGYKLPPGCPPTTQPAPVFVPIARED
jgi:hypothetical protein